MAQAVVPLGASARCSFMLVYQYEGSFPEDVPSASWGADLESAGIDMSVDE